MRKVTVICGSSNNHGFSHHISQRICSICAHNKLECTVFYPSEMSIAHCSGCNNCRTGHCIHDDGMEGIVESVMGSDSVYLVMPIHFSGPSSLMKTVMDRFQPCWFNKSGCGGSLHAIMCAGGNNPCFSYTEGIIRAFSITAGLKVGEPLYIKDTDRMKPEQTDDAVDNYILSMIRTLVE